MKKVPIVMFSDRVKAQPVRQRFIESGINAEFNSAPKLPMLWLVSGRQCGIRIEVPTEHLAAAEELLLAWDEAEGLLREAVRCPECRSFRVEYPQYAKHSLLTNFFMGLSASLGFGEKDYYCEDCHFTWPKEVTRPGRDRSHLAPDYFIEGMEQSNRANAPHSSDEEQSRKAA